MTPLADRSMDNTAHALMQCQHISYAYGKQSILEDVTFDILPGEFVGVIGSNGAGKTTLLRCLYRYLQPQTGEISFEAQSLSTYSAKALAQQIAVVIQELPNQFNLTVRDVVAIGFVPYQRSFDMLSKGQVIDVEKAVTQVGLADKIDKPYEHLSGGEKQRALIAKAIIQRPKLLILDEPTSHLDIKYQLEIMRLLKSLNITIIASIHDLNLAAAVSDKMLLLDGGKLVEQGSPIDVVTEDNLQRYFGVNAQVTINPVSQLPLVTYHYRDLLEFNSPEGSR